MHKVISINLNGHAYQVDEPGYEAVREYLGRAYQQLADNPDRAEIMADLEQAIADKCQRYLGPHKTVVTSAEAERIVAEMGPVESSAERKTEADTKAGGAAPDGDATGATSSTRRLYRVPAGAMIGGVCTGVAAYFRIDVTIIRFAFVIAALITQGAAIFAYIILMFVLPEASTPEQAYGGGPVNAREVIERAKQRSTDAGREWRRQWRRQQRQWRRQWAAYGRPAHVPPPGAAALAPVFGLAHMALFLLMAAMLISLVNTGAVFGWELPPDIPVWAGALILLMAYQIVVSPLKAAQLWSWYPGAGAGAAATPLAFWNGIVWLVGIAFAIWLASNHVPEIREFIQRAPDLVRDFARAIRDLFAD